MNYPPRPRPRPTDHSALIALGVGGLLVLLAIAGLLVVFSRARTEGRPVGATFVPIDWEGAWQARNNKDEHIIAIHNADASYTIHRDGVISTSVLFNARATSNGNDLRLTAIDCRSPGTFVHADCSKIRRGDLLGTLHRNPDGTSILDLGAERLPAAHVVTH